MPIYTSVPSIGQEHRAKAWVPLDDTHTGVWEFAWNLSVGTPGAAVRRIPSSGLLPESNEPLSRGQFAANRSNDYLLDRERQRRENFSGIEDSPPLQDAAVQESMGAIVDRTGEHPGATDAGIVRVRRRLLDAAIRLRDRGDPPRGASDPAAYGLRGSQFVIARDADWRAHASEREG